MGGLSFSILILLLCTVSPPHLVETAARGVLAPGQAITGNQTLVSAGGVFALGFFCPGSESFGRKNRYVGIWYNKIPNITVVWVANREQPVTDSAAFLIVTEDRNIAVMDSNGSSVWSTDVPGVPNGTVAMLLDSGNLVLRQRNGQNVWQSFDYPTDTYLPEMKLRYNAKTGLGHRAVAWRDVDNPSSGDFSFGAIYLQIVIWRGSETYRRSPVWTGNSTLGAWTASSTGGVQPVIKIWWVEDEVSISFTTIGGSGAARYTLESSGVLKMLVWMKTRNDWVTLWSNPSTFCDVYSRCGPSGVCDRTAIPPTCKCLQGFVAKNQTEWETNNFSSGCVRRVPLAYSKGEKFLLEERLKLPDFSTRIGKKSEAECQTECLSRYGCVAYAYAKARVIPTGSMCLVWFEDLSDLVILDKGGKNLHIRLVASELDNKTDKSINFLPLVLSVGAVLVGAGSYFLVKRLRSRARRTAMKAMLLDDVDLSDAFRIDRGFSDAPLVDFKSVRCATGYFSDVNKLGEGGFGSVYKGTLASGHVVAVKRLSMGSKQGHDEFANEVRLIARLQH